MVHLRRRPLALLLLAVFLGAGTSLPGPDALLHHWGEAGAAEHGAHVEPAGGCAAHAGHCTLGRAATGAGAVLAHGPEVRAETPGAGPAAPTPQLPVRAAHRGVTPPSRAPPAPVA